MKTPVQLGNPQEFGPIEVWPLLAHRPSAGHWGWGLSALTVGEVLEPDPNLLQITNKGPIPVFLPMGFLIGGLNQSRMVAEDLVIPAGAHMEIPAFCVEVGRFGDGQASRPAGRAPVSVMAAGGWQRETSDRQGAVWAAVNRHEQRSGPRSTHSLEQVMVEDRRTRTTQRRVEESVEIDFQVAADQIGIVATAGGEPVVMEMFGSNSLAGAYAADLIRGLAFDVDGYDPFPCTLGRVLGFLNEAREVKFQASRHDSGATSIRGTLGRVDLHGIWVEKRTYVHVAAVNTRHPVLQRL
jgi:hypothetical protein